MDWFRHHHGATMDPKWLLLARLAGTTPMVVWTTYSQLLEVASSATPRGSVESFDAETLANFMGCDVTHVTRVVDIMYERDMIDRDTHMLRAFPKRNPKREDDPSADRVRRYRQRLKEGGGSISNYRRHWPEIFQRDDGRCVYCGEGDESRLCLDHMVPVIQKGDDDPDNLALACKACNSGKSGRTPEQAGYSFRPEAVAAQQAYARTLVRVSHGDGHGVTVTSKMSPKVTPDKIRVEKKKKKADTDVSAKKEGRKRRPEVPMPEDFESTDAERELARNLGLDHDAEFERFKLHAAATDRRQRDWRAAWRLWLRTATKYGGKGGGNGARPGGTLAKQEYGEGSKPGEPVRFNR